MQAIEEQVERLGGTLSSWWGGLNLKTASVVTKVGLNLNTASVATKVGMFFV